MATKKRFDQRYRLGRVSDLPGQEGIVLRLLHAQEPRIQVGCHSTNRRRTTADKQALNQPSADEVEQAIQAYLDEGIPRDCIAVTTKTTVCCQPDKTAIKKRLSDGDTVKVANSNTTPTGASSNDSFST